MSSTSIDNEAVCEEVCCLECGVSTQGRKIRSLWNNVLCEKCGEEEVEEEEEEEELEDCECGYTHHYEDKCPNEATAIHYNKWREEEEEWCEEHEQVKYNKYGEKCSACLDEEHKEE
jgi:hypothetical protein